MTTTVPTEVSDDDFAEILNQTRQFVRNVVVPRENEILAEDRVPDDIRDRLNEHFGEVDISDLWLPFFCVSSNLTSGAYQDRKSVV